ncbi:hypothetical protein SSX86_008227 [Deinandra increscens subsp. villosa]|uniref:Mitochondrial protein n=1 Tax=Deinandra increscens subsp. villosa TaxID=3103831 RepID=A0AAP0DIR0_9ASTR
MHKSQSPNPPTTNYDMSTSTHTPDPSFSHSSDQHLSPTTTDPSTPNLTSSPHITPHSSPQQTFPSATPLHQNISHTLSTTNTPHPSPSPLQSSTTIPRTRPNPKLNSKYHNNDFVVYTTSTSPLTEPTSTKHALQHPLWHKAMRDEFDALTRNHTWSLVPPDSAQNVVGSKWVFRIKYNPDGTVERLKARFVAKSFCRG